MNKLQQVEQWREYRKNVTVPRLQAMIGHHTQRLREHETRSDMPAYERKMIVDRARKQIASLQEELERCTDETAIIQFKQNQNQSQQIVEIETKQDAIVDYYRCKFCNTVMKVGTVESIIICPNCSWSREYVEFHIILQCSSEILHEPGSSYNRDHHFLEIIELLRPMDMVEIPKNVMDTLRRFLRRDRFGPVRYITPAQTAQFLKETKLKEYYPYKYQITFLLNGQHPPTLDEKTENNICRIVTEIHRTFDRIQASSLNKTRIERKSVPRYVFSLTYALKLLKLDQFKPYLKTLQCEETFRRQLIILRSIATILKWPIAMMIEK